MMAALSPLCPEAEIFCEGGEQCTGIDGACDCADIASGLRGCSAATVKACATLYGQHAPDCGRPGTDQIVFFARPARDQVAYPSGGIASITHALRACLRWRGAKSSVLVYYHCTGSGQQR